MDGNLVGFHGVGRQKERRKKHHSEDLGHTNKVVEAAQCSDKFLVALHNNPTTGPNAFVNEF